MRGGRQVKPYSDVFGSLAPYLPYLQFIYLNLIILHVQCENIVKFWPVCRYVTTLMQGS